MSPTARPARGQFRRVEPPPAASAGLGGRASRSARLPEFFGMRAGGGGRLDALRVMVVGSGSVGGAIVLHLARLVGIQGMIRIVDPGRLKGESLLTHPIDPAAVGLAKVEYFGGLAKTISPEIEVHVFEGPVQSLSPAAFDGVDFVFMATDNLAAEVDVGRRCMDHRCVLVQASVHGPTLVAQARLWLNRDASGACPSCGFSKAEWDHIRRETTFSCGGNGRSERHVATAPTMSVSFLCSMAAEMAMTLLLRHVLGLGPPLADSMVEFCGYTNQMSTSPLARNAACPCRHESWDRRPIRAGTLARSSLADIAHRAGFDPADLPRDLSFLVDELTYVDQLACCGKPRPVARFCDPGAEITRCPQCHAALTPQLFFSHRPTPAAVLAERLGQPLRRLGAEGARWVLVRGGGRSVFCQEEN